MSEAPASPVQQAIRDRVKHIPLLLYGVLLFIVGIAMYLLGILVAVPRQLLGLDPWLLGANEWIVWYSAVPITVGMLLALVDLFVLFPFKRRLHDEVPYEPIANRRVTVALTAYNDELSIAAAVRDFQAHPLVERVIVVSNNSADATLERALEAGAIAYNEPLQGYGRCVHRCLTEALRYDDTELIVLCEGDMTFRAYDLDKLLMYAPHADIVNGTRIVEQLRDRLTQLSTFMYYGNFFAGKLLEAKQLGKGTFTDLGTTYKLCRRQPLQRLMPRLNPAVNLEFNAHFMDTALSADLAMVECPITFHRRVGVSKGGNLSNVRALKVGLGMIFGLVFGWKKARD